MNDQFGFDFGDESLQVYAELPEGTWLSPGYTLAQLTAGFTMVDTLLVGMPGAISQMFFAGVTAAREVLAGQVEHFGEGYDGEMRIWRSTFDVAEEHLLAFVAYCEQHSDNSNDGIECKARSEDTMLGGASTVGVYIEGAGSVVVRKWSDDNIGINYFPYRAHFFLSSYRDGASRSFEPCSTWAGAYCAARFCESPNSPPTVPTFSVNGREYINSGSVTCGAYRCCQAWTFVPVSEWRGATFTYSALIQAFDKGTVERGDKRGTLVKIRGQLCVIDGFAMFFDDNAFDRVMLVSEDDQLDEAVDFSGGESCEEDYEEEEAC